MTSEYDWDGFRSVVRRLDMLLAGEAVLEDYDTFAEACRRSLAFLYVAGVSMPAAGDVFEDAGGDSFWESKLASSADAVDPLKAEAEIDELTRQLAASVIELQGDAEADEIEDLAAAAARGLWDVRESLSDGIRHFDAGRPNEAAWEWSFGFDEWGAHALAATSALHDALWGAK